VFEENILFFMVIINNIPHIIVFFFVEIFWMLKSQYVYFPETKLLLTWSIFSEQQANVNHLMERKLKETQETWLADAQDQAAVRMEKYK